MLVVVPGFLYVNFGDTSTKDESGVLMENKRNYGAKLNENLIVKNMPQILASSIEFQAIGARNQAEIDLLKKLKDNDDISELLPKAVSRKTQNMNLKPLLLVLGHCLGDENVNNPSFKESLAQILKQGVAHINMMIETGMEINMMARMGNSIKKLGYKAFSTIINFQQFFVQGLWMDKDPLEQLPGFTPDVIKSYKKQLKEHQIANGQIETFCRLTPEQRAALGLFGGDKGKLAELEKVIKGMPLVRVEQKAETEGEKTITASDVISIEINITYEQLPEDQGPGYICSKAFPFVKKQNWYIVICDAKTKENVVQIERLIPKKDSNTVQFKMKQRFGQVGRFSFHAYIMNDSYIGFDKECAITVDVARDDPDRVIEPYSQEDVEAVKGPGLVQSMMQAEQEDDDDQYEYYEYYPEDDDEADALTGKEEEPIEQPELAATENADQTT